MGYNMNLEQSCIFIYNYLKKKNFVHNSHRCNRVVCVGQHTLLNRFLGIELPMSRVHGWTLKLTVTDHINNNMNSPHF